MKLILFASLSFLFACGEADQTRTKTKEPQVANLKAPWDDGVEARLRALAIRVEEAKPQSTVLDSAMIQDNIAMFDQVLQIKRNENTGDETEEFRPAYLTFEANSVLAGPVQDAHFSFLKVDPRNLRYSNDVRTPALFQESRNSWQIPLLEAVKMEIARGMPEELLWVRVDIHYESGKKDFFFVGLRMLLPLPEMSLVPKAISRSRSAVAASRRLDQHQVVAYEALTNSTLRPLLFWFRANGTLSYDGFLKRVYPSGDRPPKAASKLYRSRVNLPVNEIWIDVPGEGRAVLDLGWEWQWVEIPPETEVRVSWVVNPVGEVKRCSVPKTKRHDIRWTTTYEEHTGNHEVDRWVTRTRNHQKYFDEKWSLEGTYFRGRWRRSIALTEIFDRDIGGLDAEAEAIQEMSFSEKHGVTSGATLHSCQGLLI